MQILQMLFTATASIFLLQVDMLLSFIVGNQELIHDLILSFTLLLAAVHARRMQHLVSCLQEEVDMLQEKCNRECSTETTTTPPKKWSKKINRKNKKYANKVVNKLREYVKAELKELQKDCDNVYNSLKTDIEYMEDELDIVTGYMKSIRVSR